MKKNIFIIILIMELMLFLISLPIERSLISIIDPTSSLLIIGGTIYIINVFILNFLEKTYKIDNKKNTLLLNVFIILILSIQPVIKVDCDYYFKQSTGNIFLNKDLREIK